MSVDDDYGDDDLLCANNVRAERVTGAGLNTAALQHIYRTVVIARMTYAASMVSPIIIIIVSLFRLTNRNHNNSCHAGQHKLARRLEQQGLARVNAATNGAKQSRQPQPGRDLVGIHQMSPLEHTSDKQATTHLSTPEGWKAELA